MCRSTAAALKRQTRQQILLSATFGTNEVQLECVIDAMNTSLEDDRLLVFNIKVPR